MKTTIGKPALRMLAIIICLAALPTPLLTVGNEQDDLWRVTAHATVRTSRTGSQVMTHRGKDTSTEPHAADGNEPDQEEAQGYPEWEKNASSNPGK